LAIEDACLARADANLALAKKLAADGSYNWAVVLVFYAAVFDVNRMLARANRYSDDEMDHATRNAYVRDRHGAIDATYGQMFSASMKYRYFVALEADQGTFDRQVQKYLFVRNYIDRALAGQIPGVTF
jgi:hypothetical protein